MKKTFLLPLILLLAAAIGGCSLYRNTFNGEDTVYAAFGDCLAYGSIATPLSDSFAPLTAGYLDKRFPHTYLINCGVPGVSTAGYTGYLKSYLDKIALSDHGPLARATLTMGLSDLTTTSGCVYCGYTQADDAKVSYIYKAQMQGFITEILKASPYCQLVLCTVPDPNNGGMGTGGGVQLGNEFKPPGLMAEFNKRIWELAAFNHLQVADFYTAMMGHPEYYIPSDFHPNNAGHAVMASVIERAFDPDGYKEIGREKALSETATATSTAIVSPAATATLTATVTPIGTATETASVQATSTPANGKTN